MNSLDISLRWIQLNWTILAYGFSVYWGFHGAYFFTLRAHLKGSPETFVGIEDRRFFRRLRFSLWFVYMFISHFVCSLAGWICLYLLIARIQAVNGSLGQLALTWADLGLFTFSVLGITDHLPQTFYGVVMSLSKVTETAINKVAAVK